ncbi:glycoside hydrolase family 78 protein [Nocardioides sp. NPDC101246]|uniref:glycoside hydrolase family 78 protein n=1 Tax=Nocardioides sp. NPDC101246 TaxID=3364336 RepID=UPI00380B1D10
MTPEPARFISADAPADGGPALYFRTEFDLGDGLRQATLEVTALGIVVPWLNGTRVGEEVLAPGWTSYSHRVHVSRFEVTSLVHEGANAFGAVVGEGWAVGPLTWEMRRNNYADRPALWARLVLTYADGTERVIGTDESFRVGEGGVRSNGIYAGETFDARLEPNGWSSPGFDDSGWSAAQPVDRDLGMLEVGAAPPVRRIEEIAPVTISTAPSGARIVDFGQVLSGWVRLHVEGPAGQTITLSHAELLTPKGELERETLRNAEAVDRYTLRGGGPETWEPQLTFHGFRYVQVDGWPGELTADALRAVVVHSEMRRTGWFECSDPLVDKLHGNVVWSMRGNFVSVPTDCPQRDERLGWTGDLNAFAPTAAFLYDVRGVLGSWLRDLALEQAASGTVPWVVPDVLPQKSSAAALWSDVAVSLPWTLFEEYADMEILRSAYPSMTAFMTEVEGKLDEAGLWSEGFQFGDWLDPDAPPDNPAGGKTDPHLVASAYLCRTTSQLARTAALLGHRQDAERYAALAQRVRAAFRAEFVTANGRVTDESATAYALAIMFDILDEPQRRKAGARLAAIVAAADHRISTGFAGTPLVADALSSTGHLDTAYSLLMQTECPSFLYPVTMGATTIWERWDAVLPDGTLNSTGMTSLNHYALGAVADWMHRVVGGLERLEPGWRRIRIAPRPGGGLTSARVRHETVLGPAEVSWRVEDGVVVLEATVPEGATALVELPLYPDGRSEEVGPGDHAWRYPAPAGYGEEPELSLDTPMGDLQKRPEIWAAVLEVMRTHVPGVPFEAGASHLAEMTLNMALERLPAAGDGFADDLRAALAGAARADDERTADR